MRRMGAGAVVPSENSSRDGCRSASRSAEEIAEIITYGRRQDGPYASEHMVGGRRGIACLVGPKG